MTTQPTIAPGTPGVPPALDTDDMRARLNELIDDRAEWLGISREESAQQIRDALVGEHEPVRIIDGVQL